MTKYEQQIKHEFAYTGIAKEKLKAQLLALPALVLLFVFLILPFLVAVTTSFTDKRLLSPNQVEFIGFDNYTRLLSVKTLSFPLNRESSSDFELTYDGKTYLKLRDLLRDNAEFEDYSILYQYKIFEQKKYILAKDPLFIKSLFNTFKFVFMVVPIQVLLALMLALVLQGKGKLKVAFRMLFFAPVVTSMVVVCVVWSMLYQQDGGLFNQVIAKFFDDYQAINWLRDPQWALFSIVLLSAWQGVGIQMLILLSGLKSIPHSLYEASVLDGANKWSQFRYITLPSLKNTLIVVIISTSIFAFSLFVQVDVMTQGGPNDSTSTVLFYAIEKGFRQQQIAYGAAICIFYFVLIVFFTVLQKRLISNEQT